MKYIKTESFDLSNVYFIPANEPNHEWYSIWNEETKENDKLADSGRADAWDAMNTYFSKLYDLKPSDDIQLLTPPMSPWNFAEVHTLDCKKVELKNADLTPIPDDGYTHLMSNNGVYSPERNDGYAWNNYWKVGLESWFGGAGCDGIASGNLPHNHHLLQIFPEELRQAIRHIDKREHTFITEADLLSPVHEWADAPDLKDGDSERTAKSLRCFANAELAGDHGYGAKYMALWLLTQQNATNELDPPGNTDTCHDLTLSNGEVAWHMAYLPNGTACQWFSLLWKRPQSSSQVAGQSPPTAFPTATATRTPAVARTPTADAQMQVAQLRTPSPDAKVWHGPITEVTPTPTVMPRYRFRVETQEQRKLFVQDTQTGTERRLGTDQGYAFGDHIDDRYAVWTFQCTQCDAQVPVPTGFYAYDLQHSRPITILQHTIAREPEVDGDWMIYVQHNTVFTGTLRAYHFGTGDTIVLDDELHLRGPGRYAPAVHRSDLYAIHGTRVVWRQRHIQIYDLATRCKQTLPLPDAIIVPEWPYPFPGSPKYFSLSERVLVWNSAFSWWGYDLELAQLFPLSLSHASIAGKIGGMRDVPTVVQDHLFWSFSSETDKRVYYFTSPLLRDE